MFSGVHLYISLSLFFKKEKRKLDDRRAETISDMHACRFTLDGIRNGDRVRPKLACPSNRSPSTLQAKEAAPYVHTTCSAIIASVDRN